MFSKHLFWEPSQSGHRIIILTFVSIFGVQINQLQSYLYLVSVHVTLYYFIYYFKWHGKWKKLLKINKKALPVAIQTKFWAVSTISIIFLGLNPFSLCFKFHFYSTWNTHYAFWHPFLLSPMAFPVEGVGIFCN